MNPDLVEIVLTEVQREQLLPLVRRQPLTRQGLLFCSVAPFIIEGESRLRLQAQYVSQAAAGKILKILKNHGTKQYDNTR
jgi:hypothetical protein